MNEPTYCTMNGCGDLAAYTVVFQWWDDDELRAALTVCHAHLAELNQDAAEGNIRLLDVRDVEQPPNA